MPWCLNPEEAGNETVKLYVPAPRAWQCLKTVRVSVGRLETADPEIEPPSPPLAWPWLSHPGMWPGPETDSGPGVGEVGSHIKGWMPELLASCLCLHLLGTFLGKDKSCQK